MARFLTEPVPAPDLDIPMASSTVEVRVIDSTCTIHMKPVFFVPLMHGHDDLNCPAYSFLISHGSRHILFDLGIRKDWKNLAPTVSDRIGKIATVSIDKNVSEILDEDVGNLGIKSTDIEAIIWSHHHWDHTGNPALFSPSTALLVGPGFTDEYGPFYPTRKDSQILESDVKGRDFREIDFQKDGNGLKIGGCNAMDFFGDGSFYLLDTPGHTVGHLCALARLSTVPATFLFLAGDACHHGGEIRPTKYLPLPSTINPSPFAQFLPGGCPGAALQRIHSNHSATEPFYSVSDAFCHNKPQAIDSIHKVQGFDASPNIMIVMAHDGALRDKIDLYPKQINDWKAKNVDEKTRWAFVKDFSQALDQVKL